MRSGANASASWTASMRRPAGTRWGAAVVLDGHGVWRQRRVQLSTGPPVREVHKFARSSRMGSRDVFASHIRHRRPRSAALSRLYVPPRVVAPCAPSTPPPQPIASSSYSSTTTPAAMAARLRRNNVSTACPRLFAHAMCATAREVPALLSTEAQVHVAAVLDELQNAAPTTAATASPREAEAEVPLWTSYLRPLGTLLCDALTATGEAGAHPPLPTDGVWQAALLSHTCRLVACTDAEASDTVARLMGALVRSVATAPADSTRASPLLSLESVVRRVVGASSPVLLPVVVQALQVRERGAEAVAGDVSAAFSAPPLSRYVSDAEESLHGGCRWHSHMSDAAVRLCLQHLVQLLIAASDDRRKGRSADAVALTAAARLQLQHCCLCEIPRHMAERVKHECATLVMTALKHAPVTVLLAAYAYLREERLISTAVAHRFLAHCGVCVTHVAQTGMSPTHTIASPTMATTTTTTLAAVAALQHARGVVLASDLDLKQVETSMLSAAAALNALGFPEVVRSFYTARSSATATSAAAAAAAVELRETPHSVMSQVLLGDAAGAVTALAALGASRPEGWVSLPPVAAESMAAVSRLVGRVGRPADVDALYSALVGFHNAGLFISHYVECVLAGVCDRISKIGRQQQQQQQQQQGVWESTGPPPRAPPQEVVRRVVPVVRAALRYVGDELNVDMILELVETSLQLGEYAVPMTAALVGAFRASAELSLCMQELLCRVDASTHNAPFLHYYVLCHARDGDAAATFDHLAALWHIDGGLIWSRAAHLSPSCQLWKCAACGRLNSDRYNYCVCSALRYCHVVCGACGYVQDERLRECRSCGRSLLTKASLAGALVRQAWHCRSCRARNPARQTLLCFRCGQPTGPAVQPQRTPAATAAVASAARPTPRTAATAGAERACSTSTGVSSALASEYAAAVGVCHASGVFKMDHAARNSGVWTCVGCDQRRSTLERVCPACPQVECLPHAVCRTPVHVPRVCRHCHHAEANPFSSTCGECGSTADPFAEDGPPAAGDGPCERVVAPVQRGDGEGERAGVYHWCFHCHTAQPHDTDTPLHQQQCRECAAGCEEKGLCLLPVRRCGGCGASLPPRYAGSVVCPFCAAYVEPPPPPPPQGSHSGTARLRWTAVTVLHTCEVLDGCCARASLLAESLTSTASADGALDFLRRRPTIEQTLTRLRREWVGEDGATWLRLRMGVAVELGRALNRLHPQLPASRTARRLSALLKGILTHVDTVCGAAMSGGRVAADGGVRGYFTPLELCHECLGTHPAELCPFSESSATWACGECGTVNSNADVCRYVCGGCLALRPVMQDLLVSACWECRSCHRANVQLERHCVHCGVERAGWCAGLLHRWEPAHVSSTSIAAGDGGGGCDGVGAVEEREGEVEGEEEEASAAQGRGATSRTPPTATDAGLCAEAGRSGHDATATTVEGSAAARQDEIPFTAAKCLLCGLIYMEARCPLCLNHIPDVADAKGTVCEVRERYAFIQPSGTTRPQDRIFVDAALLLTTPLREGLLVHYTAELGRRGRMEARFLRC
ncbi:hypothetical protein NESM_000185300 [Novymonas esmeraldas]|uniref:RanBP2-type domain-containing protein n=1 Tax=Novymonas esmeraldas TaxID=1808958 RepID=A0AAW0F8A5_9TRYP